MGIVTTRRARANRPARATDGSMSIMEHLQELRSRLFWASLGIAVGLIVGYFLSTTAYHILQRPWCELPDHTVNGVCRDFFQTSPATGFLVKLKITLWIGLIIGSPVWLYQLWAFIAPGLHRHERKWAYIFVAIAAPLFSGGAVLAYLVVARGLEFLLSQGVTGNQVNLEVESYINFVTTMILLFGVAFEFPLLLLMLNFTGIASAKRLASWWRAIVFLSFAFAAIATPDPGPFGMTLLAAALSLLYGIALVVAFINDRRRAKRQRAEEVAANDDEASPLDLDVVPLDGTPEAVEASGPVSEPAPLESRYDSTT